MNARPEGEPGRSLEEIMELGDMLDERLTAYAKQNGEQLPKRIIFFRDGLSTDQFSMARGRELRRLKDAIRKRYLRAKVEQLPDIMLIVQEAGGVYRPRQQQFDFPDNTAAADVLAQLLARYDGNSAA